MRRMLSRILALAIIISLFVGLSFTAGAAEDGWDGTTTTSVTETAADGSSGSGYYLVGTAAELAWVVEQSYTSNRNTFEGKNVLLTADIDLNGGNTGVSWTPIGRYFAFCGTFNGAGHTVKGLYISGGTILYNGLFGNCNGAIIENLTVSGSIHITESRSGGICVGGVCGYASADTIIRNCTSEVDITLDDGNGNALIAENASYYVGGIIGRAYGCRSISTGLIDIVYGTVSGCRNSGDITLNVKKDPLAYENSNNYLFAPWVKCYAGGMIGQGEYFNVSGCVNDGDVKLECSADGDANVGGIAGELTTFSAQYCVNSGAIFSYSGARSHTGGICGTAIGKGSFYNCLNTGSVYGTSRLSSNYVGGVTGYLEGAYTVANCANTGAVKNSTDNYSGGVIGYCINDKSSLENCYWGGGCTQDVVVGFLNDSTLSDCYKFAESMTFSDGAEVTIGGAEYTDVTEALRAWVNNEKVAETTNLTWSSTADGGIRLAEDVEAGQTEPTYQTAPIFGSYSDAGQWAWASGDIAFVIENGLMGSTDADGMTFDAWEGVTRGMTVTILYRLAGSPALSAADYAAYGGQFTDVFSTDWYYDAVVWAHLNGVTEGTSDIAYSPNANVTREQLVTLFCRFAVYLGYDVSDAANLSGYTDAGDVDSWAADAFNWAVSQGIITGMTTTTLEPTGGATRAQIATILRSFILACMADGNWIEV